jgi:cyclic pyranopterin phosphate synthase
MRDSFGRDITYLRVSVTDRCNLRCSYCTSGWPYTHVLRSEILSFEEILRVIAVGASLGIRKLRVTGGEPLVRSGVLDFMRSVRLVPGIERVALTTNGLLLDACLEGIAAARVSSVNVSLDTLRAERFQAITGGTREQFEELMRGITRALNLGLPLKLNVVLIRGTNDDEITDFARLTLAKSVEVRFIEFMPPGEWPPAGDPRLVPSRDALKATAELGELLPVADRLEAVANIYKYRNAPGSLGFISPVTEPFCKKCNKIRLTAQGSLKSCLLSHEEVDLRSALRVGAGGDTAVQIAFHRAVAMKPKSQTRRRDFHMSDVGG